MELPDNELRRFVQRVERLTEEKRSLQEDIKSVFAEAKARGFDVAAMRILLKEREMDASELAERNALLDVYRRALGMLADTPLGRSALAAV